MKLLLPRSCVPWQVATVLTGQLRQQRLREGVTARFQLAQEWQLGSRLKSEFTPWLLSCRHWECDASPPTHPCSVSRPWMCPQQNQWREKNEGNLLRDDFRKAVYGRVPWLLFYVLVFSPRGMWDLSSLTRDWTHTPCVGRGSPNHWTTGEVPPLGVLMDLMNL